jgi:hypothetical protein
MASLLFCAFALLLVPAAALVFGADSREARDPRNHQRSLVS